MIAVGIFAHQEEQRIGVCLASLPLDRADTVFHVLVNGSSDRTEARARAAAQGRRNVVVHDLQPGGKSRTWNHLVHGLLTGGEQAVIFLDGDAEIAAGSIDALAATLAGKPGVNAVAGMPLNGRMAERYQRQLREDGGLFGDLYALSGGFVGRMRARGLRLPEDLVGDDGLVAAWAHTDLQSDDSWDRRRVIACEGAGFFCEPVRLWKPSSWRMQYRRMINYSVRFFQNRIISDIMKRDGPDGLPGRIADLYPDWISRFSPRPGLTGWFDGLALRRMRQAAD
ncbi:glycosyltransferase family A protein [Sphingobium mellinum]|uniref:glycosyltransferase family A protein n=1 Tax=Sphingobium mellinum TaxID=1387166 RepID=UPI0030EE3CF6